jgi:hypothetical protein
MDRVERKKLDIYALECEKKEAIREGGRQGARFMARSRTALLIGPTYSAVIMLCPSMKHKHEAQAHVRARRRTKSEERE